MDTALPAKKTRKPASESTLVLVVLLLASMTNLMGASAVAPALPLIIDFFKEASSTTVTLIITIPSVVVAFAGFGVGALADRIGKVRILRWGTVLFAIAGLVGFVSESLGFILVSRVFVGLGIAGISVGNSALIANIYEGEKRAKVIALQASFIGIGVLVLEYGGGLLANFGWHAPFLVYLLGLIIYVMALFALRGVDKELAEKAAQMPAPEQVEIEEKEISASTKKAMTFAAIVGCATIFFMEFFGFSYPGLVPTYVVEAGGTPAMSGLFLGFNGIALTIVAMFQPKMIAKFSRSTIIGVSLLVCVLSLVGLWLFPSLVAQGICTALEGAACGMFLPTLVQWVSGACTAKNSGFIMGCYNGGLNMGQFVAGLFYAPLQAAVGSISNVFGCLAIFAFVMAAVIFILSKQINKLAK